MSPAPAVRARSAEPADALLPAYLTAFADEAVLSWVLPDPARRVAAAERLLGESLTAAIRDGQVIVAELADGTLAGASVWQHPTVDANEPGPVYDDVVSRRLATIRDTVAGHRPAEPHLYLAAMGVRPDARGRGVGGAMLAEGLRRADTDDLPTHLEASTEDSRRLYLRHGFRDHGHPLPLPDGGPVLWPMRRPPASGRP